MAEQVGKSLSILITDDDANIRNAFMHVLNADGHFCDSAPDGRECIKKAGLKKYDLFILDLILPDISGEQILKVARDRHSDVSVLVVTAQDDEEVIDAMLRGGATAYLTKPVDMMVLRDTVARIAEQRSAAAPSRPSRDTTWS
jgi:DNA-binding response OmpR family regulator